MFAFCNDHSCEIGCPKFDSVKGYRSFKLYTYFERPIENPTALLQLHLYEMFNCIIHENLPIDFQNCVNADFIM